MSEDVEELRQDTRLMVSMRMKLVCIGAVYLAFVGSACVLSLQRVQAVLVDLISATEEDASQMPEGEGEPESPADGPTIEDNAQPPPVDIGRQSTETPQEDLTVTELRLEWVFNTSDVFADKSFGAGHYSGPTVWDVDGDGENEVVFGTRRGDSKRIWCIDQDGHFEWLYPTINQEELPGDPISKISLIDVDSDGTYELCFTGRGGILHVLNGHGQVEWTWENPNQSNMIGPPQAYDVDEDGVVEFFLGDNNGDVYRVDHTGEVVWRSQVPTQTYGQPTICDLNGDGDYELVLSPYHGNIHCLSAATGSLRWVFERAYTNPPVIVADVNRDGRDEVLASVEYRPEEPHPGGLVCLDDSGNELWSWETPDRVRMCQVIGDVDADGSIDIAVMSATHLVYCLDIGGEFPEKKWELNLTLASEDGLIPLGATSTQWSAYQLIADIDGDGQQEILWLAPYPIVTDAATGNIEAYYINPHVALDRRQENGGWWGDVDGDGLSEWIVELNGNYHSATAVYCLTMGGPFPAESPWPEYSHCAYPAEYQQEQDWLTLKAAGSNSVWFPIGPEFCFILIVVLQGSLLCTGERSC